MPHLACEPVMQARAILFMPPAQAVAVGLRSLQVGVLCVCGAWLIALAALLRLHATFSGGGSLGSGKDGGAAEPAGGRLCKGTRRVGA